jgi:hypothetical protein
VDSEGRDSERSLRAAEPSLQNAANSRYMRAQARVKDLHREMEAMLQDLRDIPESDSISESVHGSRLRARPGVPETVEATGSGQPGPLETSYQRVDAEDSPPHQRLLVPRPLRWARWQHAILAICATLILLVALSALLSP